MIPMPLRLPLVGLVLASSLAGCASAPVARGPGPQSLAAELHRGTPPEAPDQCAGTVEVSGSSRWFSSLCAKDLTPEMILSLQRALAARGDYEGAPDGRPGARTDAAVLAYQSARGLPSAVLSTRAAQQMGLIPWRD
ncbi:peptidoglycan-binding protein [Sinirhodobacter populi]|uniref:Peptidoglycan-binding protein n=1 Tax=Paenirhodobacter populi TaxID=2306993 RepID=A0A443KD06_9RHOB|nr:peptidoglycan-binding domain-containing protein [Sinirhodobacter populi]RWR30678.1 peptidoglycan-binding protein [Sinirhodobacter populi]